MGGVEDRSSAFRGASAAFEGLGRFRRFGTEGPLYEVLSVGESTVRIRVFDNGEELDYRIDRALNDAQAN